MSLKHCREYGAKASDLQEIIWPSQDKRIVTELSRESLRFG